MAEEVELLPINQTLLLIKLATANFFFFLVCVHLSMCFWLCNNDASVSKYIYFYYSGKKEKTRKDIFILTD